MVKRVKTLLKHNDSYKFNVGLGKKKKDTNIKVKISSNRMTIIPGFLSCGVKSEIAIKDKGDKDINREHILGEDLHSFFTSNAKSSEPLSVRRSARISKKSSVCYAESKSSKIRRTDKIKSPIRSEVDYETPKDTFTLNNSIELQDNTCTNSKSLFKKIISAKSYFSNNSLLNSLLAAKSPRVAKDFNTDLLRKISINFKYDIIGDNRKRIDEEIERVDNILVGKISSNSIMASCRTFTHENTDREVEIAEYLVPCKEWQYCTPPSQKLNMMYYEESEIQPAIFCADGTGRNIYELKKNVDANLVNHIDPNSVEVDKRYMQQIAGFDQENCPIEGLSCNNLSRYEEEASNYFNFNPNSLSHYIREHLKTIHARPRKTVKRLKFAEAFSRNELLFKGKELLKPSTSSVHDEMDFTFVNCMMDSGLGSPQTKFKMVRQVNMFKQTDEQDIYKDFEMSDDE